MNHGKIDKLGTNGKYKHFAVTTEYFTLYLSYENDSYGILFAIYLNLMNMKADNNKFGLVSLIPIFEKNTIEFGFVIYDDYINNYTSQKEVTKFHDIADYITSTKFMRVLESIVINETNNI